MNLLCAIVLAGCVGAAASCFSTIEFPEFASSTPLDAPIVELESGDTTGAELIALLGEPSYRLEDGRILAWRLVAVADDTDLTRREVLELMDDSGANVRRVQDAETVVNRGHWVTVDPQELEALPRRLHTRWLEVSLVAVVDADGKVTRWNFENVPPP